MNKTMENIAILSEVLFRESEDFVFENVDEQTVKEINKAWIILDNVFSKMDVDTNDIDREAVNKIKSILKNR